MSITEDARQQLFRALEQALGREQAVTLMEHLPPVGWADVATKRDLDHLEAMIRADLRTEIAGIRTEMANLRTELTGLGATVSVLGPELRSELARDLRTYGLALITVNATITALAVGLARLV